MSEKEKKIAQNVREAIKHLPESELKFLLGFTEGVIAASKRREKAEKASA